jgi:hypothetical protein
MIGLFVRFKFDEASFDAAALRQLATASRGKFEGLPGLRSKAFTIDEARRQAVNFYVWEDAAAARAFFSEAVVAAVAQRYGVRPELEFVELAELVDNAAGRL